MSFETEGVYRAFESVNEDHTLPKATDDHTFALRSNDFAGIGGYWDGGGDWHELLLLWRLQFYDCQRSSCIDTVEIAELLSYGDERLVGGQEMETFDIESSFGQVDIDTCLISHE